MLMIVLLATFSVAVAFFGAVVLHAKLAQGQVRLDGLQRAVKEQEKDRTLMRSEVARLVSPDRIVVAAKALGLVVPNGIRFLQMTAATAP